MQRLEILLKPQAGRYEINIGWQVRHQLGKSIRSSLKVEPRRAAVISNKRVFSLYGDDVIDALQKQNWLTHHWLMPDGERYKSFPVLEKAVAFLSNNLFDRNDLVVALGGGVVGDLAGFASAIYLRGIRLVQMPTTLLAQVDSSVGGKTGINLPSGKNMVGSFHQPSLVVIDTETLSTLPPRELVSGSCEMLKQSLIAGDKLLSETTAVLRDINRNRDALCNSQFEAVLASHCKFKGKIVAGDERESTGRSDNRSRRILNFGHTTAHALEAITNYRRFRHGEAVGHGMMVAGEISKNLGLLSASELELLRESVSLCGPLPRADDLDITKLLRALTRDKKSVGGDINWVLLERIGSPRIISGRDIDPKLLRLSLREGLRGLSKKRRSAYAK